MRQTSKKIEGHQDAKAVTFSPRDKVSLELSSYLGSSSGCNNSETVMCFAASFIMHQPR